MPRPDKSPERRAELLPIIADTFAELGYRRTTTAELARRCGAHEAILYRLWPDKKAMFLAAIAAVYEVTRQTWGRIIKADTGESTAERLLAYEAEHQGERGLYRILFAGLGETDDQEIRQALRETYQRFQQWIQHQIEEHRRLHENGEEYRVDATLAAWAVVGLGTIVNVSRELSLLTSKDRERLLAEVGQMVLGDKTS